MNRTLAELAAALKLELNGSMVRRLDALGTWLGSEGIGSGGLGPREASQIESRHLADSMMFAAGWSQAPRDCLDLGTGVGLPGLVLAIVWPQTGFELVDRSEKRCDLARRAARVADVDVTVTQADIWSLDRTSVAIVSRAAIPAQRFRPLLERMLAEGGRAVISGSGAAVEGFENLEILDRPSRLLMMQKS